MRPIPMTDDGVTTAHPPQSIAVAWASDELARARQELLLDEGLMETFPASDPVAVVRLT